MKNIHIQKPINADTKWHAGQTVILYRYVPEEMQGRIFAVRNALQFSTIPLGILLGALFSFISYRQRTIRNLEIEKPINADTKFIRGHFS